MEQSDNTQTPTTSNGGNNANAMTLKNLHDFLSYKKKGGGMTNGNGSSSSGNGNGGRNLPGSPGQSQQRSSGANSNGNGNLESSSEKRNRSANYSSLEKDIFLSAVQPFKHILEDKRFDSETLLRKTAAWRDIVNIFNSQHGVVRRDRKQLKELWKRLKDRARKSTDQSQGHYFQPIITLPNIVTTSVVQGAERVNPHHEFHATAAVSATTTGCEYEVKQEDYDKDELLMDLTNRTSEKGNYSGQLNGAPRLSLRPIKRRRSTEETFANPERDFEDVSSALISLSVPVHHTSKRKEGEGGRLTPDMEDRKPVIPTPPPNKGDHIMNSPPQSLHPVAMHPHTLPSVLGGVRGGSHAGTPTPPPHPVTPTIPQRESAPQQLLCVRWGNFDSNIITMFSKLRSLEHFCDVTLWCEGRTVKCHKMVLSACSTYFEQLLTENPNQNVHPIIFLKDMRFWEIQALVEFMYKGEVSIHQEKLQSLLRAAESLQIKGLGSPSNEQQNGGGIGGTNGEGEEHGGSGGSSGSHNASGSGAEDDLSNGTMDMSTSNHRLVNDVSAISNQSANNSSRVDDDILVNSHPSHTSPGSLRATNMSMGMDLSNHRNNGIQNNILGHQTSMSPLAAGWPLHPPPFPQKSPSKRRRKETPRRIDIPKGPNIGLLPHPIYASPIQSQSDDIVDDDDAMSEDSMTAHERNHIDEDVKHGQQSDMNYDDSNDGDNDGPENYAENDRGSQISVEEEFSDDGDDGDGGGGNEPLELNSSAVVSGILSDRDREKDLRERERSRKGNPIKKIHLGIIGNNNNNNNDTGGAPLILHNNAPTSVVE